MDIDNYLKKTSISYGIVYGIYSALLLYFTYKFSFDNVVIMSFFNLGITFILVFYPIRLFKINNQNELQLTQSLKIGLIVGLIGGLIYGLYTYFHYNNIDTDFVTNTLVESKKIMEENPNNLSNDDLAQAKEMTEMMVSPFTFATMNVFTLLFKAFIIALVVGMIKKNK